MIRPGLRAASLVAGLGLAAGCGRCRHDERADALPPDPSATVAATACQGRPECGATGTLLAGRDDSGRDLYVVTLKIPSLGDTGCTSVEVWIVAVVPRTGPAQTTRALAKSPCYRDVRLPSVERLATNRVRLTIEMQRPIDMAAAYEIDLAPLRIVKLVQRRPAWPGGLDRLLGIARPPAIPCELSDGSPCDHGATLPWLTIADPEFDRTGWRSTSLGDCAVLLDSAHGTAPLGDRIPVWLKVLFTDHFIYVEVHDDTFVTKGPVIDQLEFAREPDDAEPGELQMMTASVDGRFWNRNDFGTLLSSGSSGHADFEPVDAQTRRIRLPIASGLWFPLHAGFSYIDTSDALRVRQTLSSSVKDDAVLRLEAQAIECRPEEGQLAVVRHGYSVRMSDALVPWVDAEWSVL